MTARNFFARCFLLSILLVGAGCASCEDPEGGETIDLGDGDGEDMHPISDAGSDNGRTDAADHHGPDATTTDMDSTDMDSTDMDSTDMDSTDLDSTDMDSTDLDSTDIGSTDMGQDTSPSAVCGNGIIEAPEACDDGNTDDGDYCAGDCSAVTGSCGDGTVQSNESCDDGVTADCIGTHDGGDGACVATGTCSAGYELDAAGDCVPQNSTGLSTPCSLGQGWAVFKFHYDNFSTSARIDVWDASCSYSFAPGSACNVREVYPGFGDISRTSQGYPIATSSHYIRVRYSVAGLSFSNATLYVQARSYSTGASTDIEAWSPIYGGVAYGPVSNAFTYNWYATDWSNFLSPSDDPNLTAIQLYAHQGSNSLAVKGVELCAW